MTHDAAHRCDDRSDRAAERPRSAPTQCGHLLATRRAYQSLLTLFIFCLLKSQWNLVLNYIPTILHRSVSIPAFES